MSRKKKQHTKQGIKRLSVHDDLFEEEIEDDDCTRDDKFEEMLKEPFSDKRFNKNIDELQTKQGVKKLSLDDDLFNDIEEENEPDKSFDELLEESLTDKSSQGLIKEKIAASLEKTSFSKSSKLINYPEPQDEIDLHGLKGDEAELKTDFFIQDSKARGLVTIRIIVGKGTHSEGRAVLPDIVEGKIVDLKREGQIYSFKWEKVIKLKSGAVILYLT
jgi:DNA-nicking Smr family endonuclease